ncbi:MAG: hypothetical protein JWR42_2338 [Marmoricola sp.]|nr:hypothetical protein [Marmoricola sp.]
MDAVDNAVLISEIRMTRHGVGDAESLVTALRESVLLVLRTGEDGVAAGDQGGVRWVHAFTSPERLAEFLQARGEGDRPASYLTVRGDRLLDVVLPLVDGPAGLAVDVGSDEPMLFPAVVGVVPVERAIDGEVA